MYETINGNTFFKGLCVAALTILALWLPLPQVSGAQTAGTGALTGSVIDAGGGTVAGAKVIVTSQATGEARSVITDDRGGFLVSALSPQLYRVEVSRDGFKTLSISGVKVTVSETTFSSQAAAVSGKRSAAAVRRKQVQTKRTKK